MPRTNKPKPDEGLRAEYDFSHGQRGKYLTRFQEGTNLVALAPDVAKLFPDSDSVNETLRVLVRLSQQRVHTRRRTTASGRRRGGNGR